MRSEPDLAERCRGYLGVPGGSRADSYVYVVESVSTAAQLGIPDDSRVAAITIAPHPLSAGVSG